MHEDKDKEYEVLNTFSRRPCLTQILSYVLVLFINVCFWGLLQPHFDSQVTRLAIVVAFAVSLAVLLIAGVATSLLDPSDQIVRQYRNGNDQMYHSPLLRIRNNIESCLYC
jgi:hypothetical protein